VTEKPRHVGFEINAISNMLKRKAPKPDDKLTRMQMWIIGYIRNNPERDIFQGELERTFNITRATASDILKRMERDSLITRTGVPNDARRKKIILTDKAISLSDCIHAQLDRNEQLMKQGISQNELDTFFHVIDVIKTNLSTINDEL